MSAPSELGRLYTTVREFAGGRSRSKYIIGFPSQGRIEIGSCDYTYLEVKTQTIETDDSYEETAIYLVELGVVIEIEPIPYNLELFQDGNVQRM